MRIKLAVICLTSFFVAATGSTASAALPEYFKAGVPHSGNTNFTGAGGAMTLKGGIAVSCTSSSSTGKISGAKAVTQLKIKLFGCQAPNLAISCQTMGTSSGLIKTKTLKGELVYGSELLGGTLVTGLLISSANSAQPLATFTCGPHRELTVTLRGSVIAEVQPLGIEQHTTNLVFDEKTPEPSLCSKQRFLYVNAGGSCHHLETEAGVAWLVGQQTLTLVGNSTVEVRG